MSITEDIRHIKHLCSEYTFLTPRELTDFITVLHESDPHDIKNLRTLFDQDPRWIEQFYQTYRSKKQAVHERDRSAWDRIIEDQTKEFEDFSFGI